MQKFLKPLIALLWLTSIISCKKSDSTQSAGGNNPVPVISSLSPNSVAAGSTQFSLTVNGSNFITGSKIQWNGTVLTTTYLSNNQLRATIIPGMIFNPGSSTITINNPSPGGGLSNTSIFTIASVTPNPVPAISTTNPVSAVAGSSTFSLTVNGNNFVSNSIITWNGTSLTTNYINSGQLSTIVSPAMIANAGTATIIVNNPAPGGGISNGSVFSITTPASNPIPVAVSMSPSSVNAGAPSFTLTINGSNFTTNSVINWNGNALQTVFVGSTQLTAVIATALIATSGTSNINVFNPTPGGGTSGTLVFTINSGGSTTKKFLFDATKAETAGNAEWVVDDDNSTPPKYPTPAQSTITSSTSETYWTGALSSWGIALVKLGQTVETLPSSGSITYGNASNAQDLSNYNVFVIDEPNIRFTTAEKQAILNFVQNGGGLFMVSDHTISDRNGDGWDSPDIWNDFMTNNGVVNNPFGISVNLVNISETSGNVLGNPANPVLHGVAGNVTQLKFNGGATFSLNTTANNTVQGLIWQSSSSQGTTNVMSATSTYGSGRIYAVADSSPLDDGTGTTGVNLFVSWPLYSHTQLFMNASLWLAKIQ